MKSASRTYRSLQGSVPMTVMPIPVVMPVWDIRVRAVSIARHPWRFSAAWRLTKAVGIPGRIGTVVWHTLRQ